MHEVQHLQGVTAAQGQNRWTYRETRHYFLNGPPQIPPQIPYPNHPYWSSYLNHVLFPSLISPDHYKEYFGLTVQQVYEFRDRYVTPALTAANMRPYLATPDALAILFLLKLRKDIDYLSLQLFFGDVADGTLERWFHCVLDFIYSQGSLLDDLRHLSHHLVMRDILEDLHSATVNNSRCYAAFLPMLQDFMNRNPHLGQLKLVLIGWDSNHIPISHTSCFTHQQRLYSTKIHDNAIVKLVGCGMDAKGRFLFMLAASTSPSCTDQGLARYLLNVEATQGEYF